MKRRELLLGTAAAGVATALPTQGLEAGVPVRAIDAAVIQELDMTIRAAEDAKRLLAIAAQVTSESLRNAILFDVRCKVQHVRMCADWTHKLTSDQRTLNRRALGMEDDEAVRQGFTLRWQKVARALRRDGFGVGEISDVLWPDLEGDARAEALALLRRMDANLS
jgi:hypothetical protein